MNYIPLNIKTNYELLSSLIKSNDLISFLIEKNIPAFAVTDSNMFSCMELYDLSKKNNIKMLIAAEIKEYNIYLYAKNYNGYISLCNIVSKKNISSISLEEISKYNDIIAVSKIDNYEEVNKLFKEVYIGYTNKEEREKALSLTNNILFNKEILCLNEEDNEYLRYLYAIKNKEIFNEDIPKYNNHYLNNIDEIDTKTTIDFISLINIEIDKSQKHIPVYREDSKEYLRALSIKGLYKRLNNVVPNEYKTRLNYELSVIESMNFTDYFLIVYDYVLYAKKNNIMVGPGRGSAAGCLVSYTLGITEIDPLKYGLIFERFLNPGRITMPDIDVDFDNQRRDEVIEYVKNRYGKMNVGNIIAFDTMLPKQVLRDVGKTLEIEPTKIDRLCKLIKTEETLEELKNNKDFITYINRYDDLKRLFKISNKLCGLKRNTSIHAAGVVISNENLSNIMPLYKRDNNILTGYSMQYIEELGLLKMDFLSIKNLNTIFNIVNKIKEDKNITINLNKIPLDDKSTLSLFENANTSGIFQFESNGMINFLRKLKPNDFNTLIDAIALYRPSTMKNIDIYIANRKNKYNIKYDVPELKDILESTYGIIIYQEEVLEILRRLAGYTYANADIIRRAMSKKKADVIENERNKFIEALDKKGYSKDIANKIYDNVVLFAGYGFNKSHSVVYTLIAYQMAYLKAHYPLYFMTYLLNMNKSSDKIKEYLLECKTYKINIKPININISKKDFYIDNNSIIMPFSLIKNIASNVSEEIINERNENGLFKDFYDFLKRCYKGSVNKRVIISLVESGAFDIFNINKKEVINNFEIIINYINLCNDLGETFVTKPILEKCEEYNKKELCELEIKNYGFYLSNHPVTMINRYGLVTLKDIKNNYNKIVPCALLVENIKTINTKKGEKMSFLTLSDEYMTIEAIVFPAIFKRVYIEENKIYKFIVRVEKENDAYRLIVNNVIEF